MVSLTCTASRENGVTLVTGCVENETQGQSCRVRLENQLDGPVWPPQQDGVPAAGWNDDVFECVLPAGETRPIGYATPAPADDNPMIVTEAEPVDPDDYDGFEPRVDVPAIEPTPNDVVRTLGSPVPPRDAVPNPATTPASVSEPPTSPNRSVSDDQSTSPDPSDAGDHSTSVDLSASTESSSTGFYFPADEHTAEMSEEVQTQTATSGVDGDVSVDVSLSEMAARIEAAEMLSASTSVPKTTDAVETLGGIARIRTLDADLQRDAQRLRDIADRAESLAKRAEETSVPTETIEKLV